MNVRKTDVFIADVERQFEWHVGRAGWPVADQYLAAVEAVCRLLGKHPHLGPQGGVALVSECGLSCEGSSTSAITRSSSRAAGLMTSRVLAVIMPE